MGIQINKIRSEERDIADITQIEDHKIITNNICQHVDNLEKMETFLSIYNPPRLNHEEIKNPNRLITSKGLELFESNLKK